MKKINFWAYGWLWIAAHTALSKTGTEVVKRMIKGEKVTQETSELTKREWEELALSIGIN